MQHAKWVVMCSAAAALVLLGMRYRMQQAQSLRRAKGIAPTPGVLFVFGLGYTGERFARQLLGEGWKVWGTVRSREAFDRFTALGIDCVMWGEPLDLESVGRALQTTTHLLVTAGPIEQGDPMLLQLAGMLGTLPSLQWVGYLSTVSVYGDANGAEVDESSPLQPLSERGQRRVLAEQQWLQSGLPVHIFRLPGIYGPGRGPVAKVQDGTAWRIIKPGHVFARIHVDDICLALCASMRQPRPGAVYNVVDDEPAPSHIVTEYACDLLGVPPPPVVDFDTAVLPPIVRSFYAESRILKNRLVKEELGLTLRYPTYREGFQAQLAEERRTGQLAPQRAVSRRA